LRAEIVKKKKIWQLGGQKSFKE